MGKIYGVHDSYCDLVSPSGGRPGVAKFCTCDSGKKTRFEIHLDAERTAEAEAYAEEEPVLYGFAPPPPKSDVGKPKPFKFFMQQFPFGLEAVAVHMEKGCSDPGHVFLGWQDVENGYSRYTDAMLRHMLEEITNPVNKEGHDHGATEERQAIAVAANAMIRLELLLRKRQNLNLDAGPSA